MDKAQAEALQAAYANWRRQWADETGNPLPQPREEHYGLSDEN